MVKTKTPGIYRRGSRYVVVFRDGEGKQRKESARTLDEARALKAKRTTEVASGEFTVDTKVRLSEYAREWVGRYQGRGRRGFRENTREEYGRQLERYAVRYFGERTMLAAIQPTHVAKFIGWLCDPQEQGQRAAEERRAAKAAKLGVPAGSLPLAETGEDGRPVPIPAVALSDSTVRNIVAPLSACMATAMREGLIRSNPCHGVDLPHRPTAEAADDEDVRALNREQLATLLGLIPAKHRLFFRLLSATGMRISEAIALQWQHVQLDGDRPHVKVRRALVRKRMGLPKSKHARRDVPIPATLVDALRAHAEATGGEPEGLVFTAANGAPLNVSNLRRRVLKPAAEEACVSWAGFHTLRHTRATILFAEGRNAVQVQRWLGHHSAAFTLSTYVHLLDGDVGGAVAEEWAEPVVEDTRPLVAA
jgi:integrase